VGLLITPGTWQIRWSKPPEIFVLDKKQAVKTICHLEWETTAIETYANTRLIAKSPQLQAVVETLLRLLEKEPKSHLITGLKQYLVYARNVLTYDS